MTTNDAELKLCASRTALLAKRLSDFDRDRLIESWGRLSDDLKNPRTNSELTLTIFRADIERRLGTTSQRASFRAATR